MSSKLVAIHIEKWKDPTCLLTLLTGDDEQRTKTVHDWWAKGFDGEGSNAPQFNSWGIIQACKELIFDVVDGVPVLHCIMYSFDTDRGSIELSSGMDINFDREQSEAEIEEEVINALALASALDVPVYPNSKEVAASLASYHRSMLVNGFTAPDGEGDRVRLMLVNSPGSNIDDPRFLSEIDVSESFRPAEIAIIQEAVSAEFQRLDHTRALLESLGAAIAQLEKHLLSKKRNESELQSCLTRHPILFGTEYVRVIPKHRLGSEYEMDYALQRASGVMDLIEIESSALKLFTKAGNPSSYLVHAEQQVIDWLAWIECNHSYAAGNLPGLVSPAGFVIIGRRADLSSQNTEKLQRRNQLFRGRIKVLTYDDLLERARALLNTLEGVASPRQY